MNQTVALIGYGAAAVNAAITLRNAGYQGAIQAFSNAGALPYSPMMTASYAAGACDYQGMFPWDKADLAQLNVQVIADAPVTRLNVQERTITAGGQEYPYDLCLIASGAHPVGVGVPAAVAAGDSRAVNTAPAAPDVLATSTAQISQSIFTSSQDVSYSPAGLQDAGTPEDMAGAAVAAGDMCAVATAGEFRPLYLRTLEDARALHDALTSENESRILISGTSMVALKAVDACMSQGVDVTLLGRSEHIMRRTACDEIAEALEDVLREKGVDVRLSQVIEEAQPAENGHVRVTFSNGDVADYSHVLVAHGIVPNLDFVPDGAFTQVDGVQEQGEGVGAPAEGIVQSGNDAAQGLPVDIATQGIPVDEFMRTSDPYVYAAGDVARVLNIATGVRTPAGLWKEACSQGACAGRAMAAALAGAQPPAADMYHGFVPSNTITVGGCVVISGGSMELTQNRWLDVQSRNECLIAVMYEQGQDAGEGAQVSIGVGEDVAGNAAAGNAGGSNASGNANANGGEQLPQPLARIVGYNVFSKNGNPATSLAYDQAAMLYRQMMA